MTTTKLKSVLKHAFGRANTTMLAVAFLLSFTLSAQETTSKKSLFETLSEVEKINLVITTDLEKITGERNLGDAEEAKVQVYGGRTLLSEWDIKLEQRGRFRRKVCNFPPLKLDFDKDELKAQGLAKYDKFKLVTHCIEDKFYSTENVAKEFLAYQLYNEVTPYSYRTILTKVTYIDRKNPKKQMERYGILIEPTKELADRIDAKEMEDAANPGIDILNPEVSAHVSMFQYMIGNEDWSIQLMRNIKAFQSKTSGKYILVPYDFDFSGLVNASYAIPSSDHKLSKVTDRAFIGKPTTAEILEQTKLNFLARKNRFEQIIKNTKRLSGQGRFLAKIYLEGFFDNIDGMPFPTLPMSREADSINGIGK